MQHPHTAVETVLERHRKSDENGGKETQPPGRQKLERTQLKATCMTREVFAKVTANSNYGKQKEPQTERVPSCEETWQLC